MNLYVSQLQIDSVGVPFEVATCVSCTYIKTGGSATIRLRSNYDGSPPLLRAPDESSDRDTAAETTMCQPEYGKVDLGYLSGGCNLMFT
jgi:hypothetical protein